MGAGDAASAEAGQQEEAEEEIVADFALAPDNAASGAPEEFPLTTGDSPEAEVPPDDYEQDLGQVRPSLEPAVAEGDEAGIAAAGEEAADVEVEGEPVAVQEEGAESEHPLVYHPISSVLARPTILRPAVTANLILGSTSPACGNSSRQSS